VVDCSRQMVRQHGSCVDRSAFLSFGAQRVLRSWLTSASHGPRQMRLDDGSDNNILVVVVVVVVGSSSSVRTKSYVSVMLKVVAAAAADETRVNHVSLSRPLQHQSYQRYQHRPTCNAVYSEH